MENFIFQGGGTFQRKLRYLNRSASFIFFQANKDAEHQNIFIKAQTDIITHLDIISRYNHSLPVGYVPVSRDATVYYGGVDFKFKNNNSYSIK